MANNDHNPINPLARKRRTAGMGRYDRLGYIIEMIDLGTQLRVTLEYGPGTCQQCIIPKFDSVLELLGTYKYPARVGTVVLARREKVGLYPMIWALGDPLQQNGIVMVAQEEKQ